MNDFLDFIARVLIAFIFLYEAYDSIAFFKDTKEKMTEYGLSWNQDVLLVCAIILLIVGGVFLLIGYRASFSASILLLYWIPVTFIVHSFWNDPEAIRRLQSILFMKNLAITGGLLMIIVNGSGRYSVKRLLGRYKIRENEW